MLVAKRFELTQREATPIASKARTHNSKTATGILPFKPLVWGLAEQI
jgi:hypothetical protein